MSNKPVKFNLVFTKEALALMQSISKKLSKNGVWNNKTKPTRRKMNKKK